MKEENQIYSALALFADLIGQRVAAHLDDKLSHSKSKEANSKRDNGVGIPPKSEKNDSRELPDSARRLIPVMQWSKHHDFPKLGRLRELIFYAETNGFKKVIRRMGRSVLIDEEAFFEWIEEQSK